MQSQMPNLLHACSQSYRQATHAHQGVIFIDRSNGMNCGNQAHRERDERRVAMPATAAAAAPPAALLL
jgi:hypothetical protein